MSSPAKPMDAAAARAAILADLAQALGVDPHDHPAPEVLWEYQEGLLDGAEKEALQDHLSLCPRCAREVLELAGAVEPEIPDEEGLPPLSDERLNELWPRLRAELPLGEATGNVLPFRRRIERVALPLAAALLIAVIGLSLWVGSLARAGRPKQEPTVNEVIVELVPLDGEGPRFRGKSESPAVYPDSGGAFLKLVSTDTTEYPHYRAELRREGHAESVWTTDGLVREATGGFSLRLSAPYLGAAYSLNLFGLDDTGKPHRIAEYWVDLRLRPRRP